VRILKERDPAGGERETRPSYARQAALRCPVSLKEGQHAQRIIYLNRDGVLLNNFTYPKRCVVSTLKEEQYI